MKADPDAGLFLGAGLPKAAALRRYRLRRASLARSAALPILIHGAPSGPGADEVWGQIRVPIWQEPLFLWLTGLNQCGSALWLSQGRSGVEEVLFLPKKDTLKEFWEGRRLGAGDAASAVEAGRVTGIARIEPMESLRDFLSARIRASRGPFHLGTFWNEKAPSSKSPYPEPQDSRRRFKTELEGILGAEADAKASLVNLQGEVWKCRRSLDAVDRANSLEANRITGDAFAAILPKISRARSETAVRGLLEGELIRRTPWGLSFPSIVAGGSNAAVLHYERANQPLPPKGLLLLDFGARWYSMHADISRTVPVNGRFNPLQKILYEIVLEVQTTYETWVKPGPTLRSLNTRAWELLNKLVKDRFLDRGGLWKKPYDEAPHGISHLIGEAVHDGDPFGDFRDRPLEAGWLISNEPGIYGEFSITMGGRKYREHLGIRIEDNLIVTKNGCENLSRRIPKKIAELEKRLTRST
jgi:Xaa-Pro aminopeptidase